MSTVTIAAKDWRRALEQVLRVASTDPEGGVLRGVLVEASGASLRFVATDKHRLVVSEVPIADGAGATFRAVLDADTLAEVREHPVDEDVAVSVGGSGASVSIGGHSVEIAVLDGDFPDHRAVLRRITGDADVVPLIADRAAVVDALEELPDDEPLRVQLKAGALELGQLVPIGVDANYDGPTASLFVEPTYLHDAVVAAAGPRLVIEAADAKSPIVVRSPGDHSYLAVVMPVLVGTSRSRKR